MRRIQQVGNLRLSKIKIFDNILPKIAMTLKQKNFDKIALCADKLIDREYQKKKAGMMAHKFSLITILQIALDESSDIVMRS